MAWYCLLREYTIEYLSENVLMYKCNKKKKINCMYFTYYFL